MKFLLLAALLALPACGGSSGTKAGSSRDLISEEEIKSIPAANAFEVVQKLRPSFFSTRGPQSMLLTNANNPIVYLNGTRFGDLQSLKSIHVESIKEIKLIRPSDAGALYGPDHNGGVIAVKTQER